MSISRELAINLIAGAIFALIILVVTALLDLWGVWALVVGYVVILVLGVILWFMADGFQAAIRKYAVAILIVALVSIVFNIVLLVQTTWPPALITYYSFENDGDLDGWRYEGGHVQRSSERAFDGRSSLEAILPASADQATEFYLYWDWNPESSADVIVGQVYWPKEEGVKVVWAQACANIGGWSCTGFGRRYDGWNVFVLDLSEMEASGVEGRLDMARLPGIVIQGELQSTSGGDMPVYIDSIQIFRDGMPPREWWQTWIVD